MADPAIVLLAAGLSRRFGGPGKLLAAYRGKPLALHIADTLSGLGSPGRVAVCRLGDEELARLLSARGFRIIRNPDASRGLSSSLALGIGAVLEAGAALVCLADMPNISAGHFRRLIAEGDDAEIVASHAEGGAPTPPALFRAGRFPELLALEGDKGARGLLQTAQLVTAPAGELADFDTEEDFASGERLASR